LLGGIVYGFLIILLKVLSKDEFLMLPYGEKLYKTFEKIKIGRSAQTQ